LIRVSKVFCITKCFAFLGIAIASGISPAIARASVREIAVALRLIPTAQNAPVTIEAKLDFNEETFSGKLIAVKRQPLLVVLQPLVDPQVLEKIKSVDPQTPEWISIKGLTAAGIQVRFEEKTVELYLTLESRDRRKEEVLMSGKPYLPGPYEEVSKTAPVSSVTNIYAGQDYRYGEAVVTQSRTRQPLDVSVDSALQVKSVVLEGSARYHEPSWIRGDLRAFKDFEDAMVRVTAGDLSLPVGGFQRFRPMAGVSVVSQFNLQPYRVITPVGSHEVLLSSPSTLRFYLNGRLFQTLYLAAGRYDLRNFPLSPGVNDVLIEVTDASGRVEKIKVPYLYSEQLLAENLHRFSYAAGFPSTQTPTTRTYDQKNPNYLLSHAAGLSSVWTLGAFTQGDSHRSVFGLNSAWSTPIGTWSAAPVVSKIWGNPPLGSGFRVAYQWTDHGGPDLSQRNFGLFFEKRTVNLALLGDEFGQFQSTDFGGSYGQQLFWRTSASLGASTQTYHTTSARSLTFNAILNRVWMEGLDSSLTYSHTLSSAGEKDQSVFLFATWSFPEKRQLLSASASTDDYARLQWNLQPASRHVGEFGAQAGVETNQGVKKADLRGDLLGNRGLVAMEHDSQRDAFQKVSHRTGARVSTGIFFAADDSGAGLALGRPATDGFAMVKAGGALNGEKVVVNPDEHGDYEASNGLLGPAIVPDLVSYRYASMQLHTPEVRPGLNIPKETFLVKPIARGGAVIALSQEETVFLTGRILDESGKPLALWMGEVESLHNARANEGPRSEAKTFQLFTNREGEYVLEGMVPGNYRLIPGDDRAAEEFSVTLPIAAEKTRRVEKEFIVYLKERRK